MNQRILAVAALALLAACQDGLTPPPDRSSRGPAPVFERAGAVPGRYIVVFTGDVADVSGTTRRLAETHGGSVRHTYQYALHGFAGDFSAEAIEQLRRDPAVDYIETDGVVRMTDTQVSPPSWSTDRVDQLDLPLSGSYTYNTNGAGVHIYIIDTGIRVTHTDFGGRATFEIETVGDGILTDCNGHGTHVAGSAAGNVYGLAKGASLHAVRVLDCGGSGSFSGVIAGVDWVTANHLSPAVANMSLGGSLFTSLNTAVTNSINSGVVYALSAGNEFQNACNVSPASTPLAITVAASSITDGFASFSNWGSCVDIIGPGVNVVSAWNTSDVASATLSGTSMSSPHVAGAAALYRGANPGATTSQVAAALTGNATPSTITGVPAGTPNLFLYTGFIGGTPGNQPPVANFTFTCTGLSCNFDGSNSSDDQGVTSWTWNFGDGSPNASGSAVPHSFAAAGTYNVTLTVADAQSLTDDTTRAVTVTNPAGTGPTARFTFTCTNLACSFDASPSTIVNRPVRGAVWSWGDGTPNGTGQRPTHTFAAAGTYNVTFTLTDGLFLADDTTRAVTVTVPPPPPGLDARFTFSCSGLTCTFDGRSSVIPNGWTSAVWNFGDGTTTSGRALVTKTYATAGTRTVTWTITDSTGASDTESKTVTVP